MNNFLNWTIISLSFILIVVACAALFSTLELYTVQWTNYLVFLPVPLFIGVFWVLLKDRMVIVKGSYNCDLD
jgi:hypothetical protein